LENAISTVRAVDSYHSETDILMLMEMEGLTMEMPMVLISDYQAPDRMQTTVTMAFLGEEFELQVITVRETDYILDPEIGEWVISPEPMSFLPAEGWDYPLPEDMDALQLVGKESLNGVPVYHLEGLVSAEDLDLAQPGLEADLEGEMNIEYWIGVEDSLVWKVVLDGELAISGPETGTVVLTTTAIYSDYDIPVNIQPPEVADTTAASEAAITGLLDCEAAGAGYLPYGDDKLGIGFCHPAGWVVDDTVELSGFLAVSPEGFGVGDTVPDCLVLIYPHGTLAQFPGTVTEAEGTLALGFILMDMIVQDTSPSTLPVTETVGDQEITTIEARGTAEEEEVLGIISGLKRGAATGMAIGYLLDEEAYRATAEGIMGSIVVALPELVQAGEAHPVPLNEFHEGRWTADQPGRHSFRLGDVTSEPLAEQVAVLVVSQLLAQGGLDDKGELQIYDPEGQFVDGFTTGWMHAQSFTQDPDGGWVQHYTFGFLEPDALRAVLEQAGEYTTTVSGDTFRHEEGRYRLGIFDMQPDSPAVLDLVEDELGAGEYYEYEVDGIANRATIAYLRPIGPQAEELTLSLELLNETGERLEEKHNYMHSGDDVFLYWVPPEAAAFTLLVTEVEGQPAQFELTLLREPRAEEPESEDLFCDKYVVEIEVREDGTLQVEEQQTFVSADDEPYELRRTLRPGGAVEVTDIELLEGDIAYTEAGTGEVRTYHVTEGDDEVEVHWYSAGTPESTWTFTLRYTVIAGVQKDTEGRDVITWQAIQPDRDHRVRNGQVVVSLPTESQVHEFIAFGAQGEASAKTKSTDIIVTNEVIFDLSHDLLPGQGMEIRIVSNLE
jgi:hypothetical protein